MHISNNKQQEKEKKMLHDQGTKIIDRTEQRTSVCLNSFCTTALTLSDYALLRNCTSRGRPGTVDVITFECRASSNCGMVNWLSQLTQLLQSQMLFL